MEENNKPVQPAANPEPTPVSATPVQTATATPADRTSPSNNKKKLIGGIIAAVFVVAAIAYGVFAYVTNQPDYMLGKAIEQMAKEEALAAKFKVTTGTESNGTTFSGDFAAREDKATKNGEAVIGIGTGDSRVTLSARIFEDMTYLRFGSLNNLPNLVKTLAPGQEATYESPEFKEALGRINDKWFSLTKEEVAGIAQGAAPGSATGFKAEDFKKMGEIYNKHPFFKADKTYADESIDGVNTAHFSIKIDKPTYKNFLTDLKNANLESIKVTDEDIANSDKDADDFAKNAAVEVWIARDSKKFKQVKFAGLEKGSESTVVLTMVTDLPAFDKLEKPADAKPFTEFMTLFLGPSLGTGLDPDSGMNAEDLNQ